MAAKPTQLRIVVADDNNDTANTLAKLLMIGGYRVQAIANDGQAALDAIRHLVPHVAILDVGMPKLTGNDVAKRVRAEIGPCPYLIAISGWGTAQDRTDAYAAGFDAHLTKPAPWVELDDILRLLASRQTTAANG